MTRKFLFRLTEPASVLTLERAVFYKRFFFWRLKPRHLMARHRWDERGRLSFCEEDGESRHFAYDEAGNLIASYLLDGEGQPISREIWERDSEGRPLRKIMKTASAEEVVEFEHDRSGRMTTERRGHHVRIKKLNQRGLMEQDYLYDGENPDLVTLYRYDDADRLITVEIRGPDNIPRRQTFYEWDEAGRLTAERRLDADKQVLKDETYTYGAVHGGDWLERMAWVPTGRRGKRRRPRELIYRSFTYRHDDAEQDAPFKVIAFPNGVYRGQVMGGRPEGNGVFQHNDGGRYEGEFHNGLMEGRGRMNHPDGRLMEGQFLSGHMEGEGMCRWTDGSEYRGNFRKGSMEGQGILTRPDGMRFRGLFEDGRYTDRGVWEHPENEAAT